MAGDLLGILCACAGLAGVLLVMAALLKLAVVMANKAVGAAPVEKGPSRGGIAEWDWDDWDDEEEAAFASERPARRKQAIPEPGVPKCMGVMVITAFAAVLGFVLLGFAAESAGLRMRRDDTRFAVAIVDLPFVSLILSFMLVITLPTGFWRAAMVTFIYGCLLLALGMMLGTVLFVMRAIV